MHRQLFSRERDELILNIADAGAIVIDGMKSISPQTAKKIPKDLQPGLIEITRSDFAITTVRTAEKVRFLGLFLPFLGIACSPGRSSSRPIAGGGSCGLGGCRNCLRGRLHRAC